MSCVLSPCLFTVMIRLAGKQSETARYFHMGYTYHLDRHVTSITFRCSKRNSIGCDARVYSSSLTDLENAILVTAGTHKDDADNYLPLEEQFKAELTAAARSDLQKDSKILFDDIKRKEEYNPIRDRLTYYDKYEKIIEKIKKEMRPPIPRTLEHLENILEEYVATQNIYRGCVRAFDNSVAVIFIHPVMLQALRSCKTLSCDGTFKTRPRQPRCSQVFIIHVRKMLSGLPAVFTLTSSKTAHMYDAVWDRLLELVPEMKENIEGISSDFERAQIKSAKGKFPNARIWGCLFHFKTCLGKRWGSLRIPGQYEHILEKAYALAHLPANLIPEGVAHITSLVDSLVRQGLEEVLADKLEKFTAYLRTYWQPLAYVFSAHGNPVKTNNSVENFHLHWYRRLGTKPNVYDELDQMNKVMQSTASVYEKAERGGRISQRRPFALQSKDLEVRSLENEVALGSITVAEFLSAVAALRRFHLSRVFWFNERNPQALIPQPAVPNGEVDVDANCEDEHFAAEDVDYFLEVMSPDPSPGGTFENDRVERRNGRTYQYRDLEQMPLVAAAIEVAVEDAVPPVAPRRRVGRPRIRPQAPTASNDPPRRRGRPRRVDRLLVEAEVVAQQVPLQVEQQRVPDPVERSPSPRVEERSVRPRLMDQIEEEAVNWLRNDSPPTNVLNGSDDNAMVVAALPAQQVPPQVEQQRVPDPVERSPSPRVEERSARPMLMDEVEEEASIDFDRDFPPVIWLRDDSPPTNVLDGSDANAMVVPALPAEIQPAARKRWRGGAKRSNV